MANNSNKKVEEQDPLTPADDIGQEEPQELSADEIMEAMNKNAEAEASGEEGEKEEKPEKVETAPPTDSHREALFEKYDRSVAKKGNKDLKNMIDPVNEVGDSVMEKTLEENGEGPIEDAKPDEAEEAAAPPETPKEPAPSPIDGNPNMRANPDDPNDPLVKTQVYGHVTWVPTSSLVSNHQKREAERIKVERAKETLAQAGELPTQQTPPQPAQPSPDVQQGTETPAFSDEDLTKTVEALQYGDAEQAKIALSDLLLRQQTQQAPMPPAPSDVSDVVQTAITARQEKEEMTNALENFKSEYEDIYNDEHLRSITVDNIHLEIAMDFINAGFTPDEVEAAYPSSNQLVEAHTQARYSNSPEFVGFRKHNELFTAAGDKTREWRDSVSGGQGNGGRPAPTAQDRQANKEGIKNAQPSDRGSTPPAQRARRASTQQTRKDAITALRESRGQTYG